MTLSAWSRPGASQEGWRTILHRQTDDVAVFGEDAAGERDVACLDVDELDAWPPVRLAEITRHLVLAAPDARVADLMDTDVRGFGVRVTDKGQCTFILLARYPGSTNPTRRAIGAAAR